MEKLSFATFDPNHSYPPYLNSPRSLEACRRIGVEPIELVEVPIEEFRKDFPHDPTCVAIRFERIDGSRRRNLRNAIAEWKSLCDSGWTSNDPSNVPKGEIIIDTDPGAYCTLLEIQAKSFRRFEKSKYDKLQALLTREISLTKESRDKKESNDSAAQSTEEYQMQMKEKRNKIQEQIALSRKNKMDELKLQKVMTEKQIREYHQMRAQEIQEQQEIEKQMERRRRMELEKRESERLKAERYAEELKARKHRQEQAAREAKEKAIMMKEMEAAKRLNESLNEKSLQASLRHQRSVERYQLAKQKIDEEMENKRTELMNLEKEADDHVKLMKEEERDSKKKSSSGFSESQRVRTLRMKQLRDELDKMECERLEAELQFKDQLHENEKARMMEHRERRAQIKLIREEAFQLCHARTQKAEEVKREALLNNIQQKSDRVEAIKKGNQTLQQLRGRMDDVMIKATSALKEEIEKMHFKRHDKVTTDDISKKAIQITESLILPNLERRFPQSRSSSRARTAGPRLGPESSVFSKDGEESFELSAASTTFTDYRQGTHRIVTLTPLPNQHSYFQQIQQQQNQENSFAILLDDPAPSPFAQDNSQNDPRSSSMPSTSAPKTSDKRKQTPQLLSLASTPSESYEVPSKPNTRGGGGAGGDSKFGPITFNLRPQPPSTEQLAAVLNNHKVKIGDIQSDNEKPKATQSNRESEKGFSQATHTHIDFKRFLKDSDQLLRKERVEGDDDEEDDMIYGGWSLQSGQSTSVGLEDSRSSLSQAGSQTPLNPFTSSPNSPSSQAPLPPLSASADDDDVNTHLMRPRASPSSSNHLLTLSVSTASFPSLPSSSPSFLKESISVPGGGDAVGGGDLNYNNSNTRSMSSKSPSHASSPHSASHSSSRSLRGPQPNYSNAPRNPYNGGNAKVALATPDTSRQQQQQQLERLALGAQVSVVAPEKRLLEETRKTLNQELLQVIEEEKQAEESRLVWMQTIKDREERAALERVFAEERQKASNRIIRLTKEHELKIKQMTLNLLL